MANSKASKKSLLFDFVILLDNSIRSIKKMKNPEAKRQNIRFFSKLFEKYIGNKLFNLIFNHSLFDMFFWRSELIKEKIIMVISIKNRLLIN